MENKTVTHTLLLFASNHFLLCLSFPNPLAAQGPLLSTAAALKSTFSHPPPPPPPNPNITASVRPLLRRGHLPLTREVHAEANQARERASEVKLRRQEQAAAHREKIRQAYLLKKLEKLKATLSSAEQSGSAAGGDS